MAGKKSNNENNFKTVEYNCKKRLSLKIIKLRLFENLNL